MASAAVVVDATEQKDSPTFQAAVKAVADSVIKLDHFQAIYRLPKLFEGAPNYRKVEGFPVFGTGQPTLEGLRGVTKAAVESGLKHVIWTCMRQEPIVYAGNMSMAPRATDNMNENMQFHGVDGSGIEALNVQLVDKVKAAARGAGGKVEYWQDTFAENPADRVNSKYIELVKDPDKDVKSLTEAYQWLRDTHGTDITLFKVPIADERAPSPHDFDNMVNVFKKSLTESADTAYFFNCQMGKGRTTTGMVCCMLVARACKGPLSKALPAAKPVAGDAGVYSAAEVKTGNADAGEYQMIIRLVMALDALKGSDQKDNALSFGQQVKAEVDDACDRAHHMQNLRTVVNYTKTMAFKEEAGSRRDFWKEMSINFIERYFYLILFNAYLHLHGPSFDSSFVAWLTGQQEILNLLGDRKAGPLHDFNWE